MMEGWLTKRRDHMNIIWTERYFILDGNNLRYYKKRGDPTPRGTYVLTNGCVVGKVFNSEEKHKHHDQVWMFRITFSVGAGEKSYKKDRFVDLGAKDEKMAEAWKKALEQTISAIKEVAVVKEEILKGADVGKLPEGVTEKILDTDNVSLFNLDGENAKAEQGWWLVRVEEGLRIMQESPQGHQVAASMYAHHANLSNSLLYASTVSAVLAFSVMHSMVSNMLVCFLTALGAVAVCAVTLMPKSSIDIPSLRVSQVVHGSPTDVFKLIMNTARYQRWDSSVASIKVIQAMDDHSDIIYVQLRPVYIWPKWQKPRDLVLMRYWRREEDGSYFVMYQSTTHPECRVRHNYVRASILGGGYVIAPQKSSIAGGVRSLVTYVLRYDPKGNSRIYHQLGMDVDLVLPMLRSIVGMRDELSAGDFITPIVTVTEDSESSRSVDPNATVPHVVQKFKTSLPEKMWAEPDASLFSVRGPNYLNDKKKVPSKKSRFCLVGVDLFAFENEKERYHLASRPGSHVQSAQGFTFVINMIIPSPNNMSMVFYYQPDTPNIFDENTPFSDLLNDFLDGDDAFRNSRFKLIPTVVEGTFIVKQAVGSVPTLLGNKLSCPYYRGSNYFEVDIDISSNSVANTVVGMVKGMTKLLVVDLAFLLESQSEEELPEQILGTVRLQNVSLDNPIKVPALQKQV
ncbi:hypothetical protein LEN26_000322 [Aphanomyces euteiches]|uniref:START domain-containing protein n=1 Tax=Aphanomyces euteiches TaxID=100861 RepID=A0A6G0WKJ4_9STRA|nr:hypothetical protein Ae201684_014233 [Aphanomyces euteiches]KAH9069226.1 hypothetical protein Ae201684P_004915 [Aphanomyces euteiches]KAH9156778.1 hypothetical protein AeRB84_001322 [Aphanomyces euteiches]KAH9163820.1 hypothetical protein LEN26_000322 [Aphanomyces euteiches]